MKCFDFFDPTTFKRLRWKLRDFSLVFWMKLRIEKNILRFIDLHFGPVHDFFVLFITILSSIQFRLIDMQKLYFIFLNFFYNSVMTQCVFQARCISWIKLKRYFTAGLIYNEFDYRAAECHFCF